MKIVIVAGGTGGHLYPGIALARSLTGHDVLFAVRRGDLGREILEKEGFAIQEISGQGLPRAISFKIFTFPLKFVQGWIESKALLQRVKPDWVVGMGGYLSVPMILTAKAMRIKTLLHEQNVFPGLANRFLSRWADSVAISFPASADYFKGETWVSGLPIRPDIGQADRQKALKDFGLANDLPTFLVFGGSLGAQKLNTLVTEAWGMLLKQNMKFQILHITGSKEFERVEKLYAGMPVSAKMLPYCHDMASAYAAADAVLCRAGASTVAELQALSLPALLIPYPFASNNHQLYNAEMLQKQGMAKVILDKDLKASDIADFFASVLTAPKQARPTFQRISAPAAAQLAQFLISRA